MPNKHKKARYQGKKLQPTIRTQAGADYQDITAVMPGAAQPAATAMPVRKVQTGPMAGRQAASEMIIKNPLIGKELAFIGALSAIIVVGLVVLYFVLK